jgi:serine/threonine protein phosphatase PrpC
MIRQIQLFGITDVGRKRTHNEDNFAICKDVSEKQWEFRRSEILDLSAAGAVLVVADGMGGTNAGEIASDIAQQYVMDAFNGLEVLPESVRDREKWLVELILGAHKTIVKHQHEHLDTAGMGTTLVVAWVLGDSVYVAWSGDSRCYLWGDELELRPFTDDHSMVWELVKTGNMTPEEARTHPESNLIMQSLGSADNPPKPSVRSRKLFKGDRVLVCSDGLNGMISDQDIRAVLEERLDVAKTCSTLVNLANEAGGHDNITCLMLDIKDADDRPVGLIMDTNPTIHERNDIKKGLSLRGPVSIIFLIVLMLGAFWTIWQPKEDESGNDVNDRSPEEVSEPVIREDTLDTDDFDLETVTTDTSLNTIQLNGNDQGGSFDENPAPDIIQNENEIGSSPSAVTLTDTSAIESSIIEMGVDSVGHYENEVIQSPITIPDTMSSTTELGWPGPVIILPDTTFIPPDTSATIPPDTTGNGASTNDQ